MAKSLTKLPKKFRRAGLRVRVVKGWRSRRASSSSFNPVGVMFHHTASNRNSGKAPALGICTHGRPGLPGPLCQILVARDGTIYMVAAGRANHAGEGGPHRNVPRDSGNTYFVGFECENDGVGEQWPERQREAIAIAMAVTLRHLEAKPNMLIGHKEWTSRKIDPANISMSNFRDRVEHKMMQLKRNNGRL